MLGREEPTVDVLMTLLDSMQHHHYGEQLNMLDHSLQTAALARLAGASDEMVAAALLHDIGHVCDKTNETDDPKWGVPTHAEIGARFLQHVLPSVCEPIRLHVDAKRFLVATDADYASALSEASTVTLAQQGGPFDAVEAELFAASEHSSDAIRLRKWDDHAKVAGLIVEPLGHYRSLLTSLLGRPARDGAWFRDACRCPECRDPRSGQHLIDVADLDGWTVVDSNHGVVTIRHDDGRTHRCAIHTPHDEPERETCTWGSEHVRYLTERSRSEFDHAALDRAVDDLDRFGIALVMGLPDQPGTVLSVAQSIGFVRETNYGRLFDVVTVPDPDNLAYSALGLPLHTDNPYREPCPGVQLLHCLRSAHDGGASRFSDGVAAADRLRNERPDAFATLTQMPMHFRFVDELVDLRAERPLIQIDATGRVTAVSVNHRSMQTPAPGPDVERFYEAYRAFRDYFADPAAVVELTLRPGDLVMFDNRRVLHGRSSFSTAEPRHLQGCYIDIDAVRSRARRFRRVRSLE